MNNYLTHIYTLSFTGGVFLLGTQVFFDLSLLALFGLVPLFLIPYWCQSYKQVAVATTVFMMPYVVLPAISAIVSFQWVSGFSSFVWLVKLCFSLFPLLAVGYFVTSLSAAFFLVQRKFSAWFIASAITLSFLVFEYGVTKLLLGFNIFTVQYAWIDTVLFIPIYTHFGSFGLVVLAIIVNCIIATLVHKQWWGAVLCACLCILLLYAAPKSTHSENVAVEPLLRVAVLPYSKDRDAVRYSVTEGETLVSDRLRSHLREIDAQPQNIELVIYPGAPWQGFLLDNASSSSQLMGISTRDFQAWVDKNVPANTVLVTWHVFYQDGNYYNDVGYWQPKGEYQLYRKEHLLPISDYNPKWLLNKGISVLPFDAVSAADNSPMRIENNVIDTLICSEVTSENQVTQSSDLILLVGSESFLRGGQLSPYMLLLARKQAAIAGKPVIRVSPFGISASISRQGVVHDKQKDNNEIFYSTVY